MPALAKSREPETPAYLTRAEAERLQHSARWSPPPGALKTIPVMLSPLAPACEGLLIDDNARWRFLAWTTPAAALRLVLRRLQRRPGDVALRHTHGLDGTEVHDGANDPPPGCERLLAIIFDAPAAALFDALAALKQPEPA